MAHVAAKSLWSNSPGALRSACKRSLAATCVAHCILMYNYPGADNYCGKWHVIMLQVVYFGYRSSESFGASGRAPQWGPAAGMSEGTLRRLDSEGKLGVVRRRILGLPDTGTGVAGAG